MCDFVGGKPSATSVLKDDVRVGCHVDTVELVVGYVTLQPTDLGSESADYLVGLLAD
jgi:hypothetical protein